MNSMDMTLLETIMRELDEAVVLCDHNARILLCNAATRRLFKDYGDMAPGLSLYDACKRPPIAHALMTLKHRDTHARGEADTSLVCATVDNAILLHCRIRQVTAPEFPDPLLIFTFSDITRHLAEQGRPDRHPRTLVEELRAPITNLSAAAENLEEHPEMDSETRGRFEKVLLRESRELARRFDSLIREHQRTARPPWPLADVNSADLLGCVVRRFSGNENIDVTMTGLPLWLRADSYSLMLALEALIRFVHEARKVRALDLEALLGDRRVYIDIVWSGTPIAQAALDAVLGQSLPEAGGDLTVAEVLARHDSEIWSQEHRREGYALLRLPAPDSPRQWQPPMERRPAREDFHDFSLIASSEAPGKLADRPLSTLTYVVFDTETTGLHPAAGGEILKIDAVRIVNGRIMSGERFERLVKPSRPIPAESKPFLEITEEMVRDAPPIQVVLPEFRAFAGNAVLAAHNAAFDLEFFRRLEAETGVRLENPLLDTLPLSLLVDEERTEHTLRSIGRDLGIEFGTLAVMGGCLVTAQVFLRLLEILDARGLTTLGRVIAASTEMVEKKMARSRG